MVDQGWGHYGGSWGPTRVDQGGSIWWINEDPLWCIKGGHYGGLKGVHYGGLKGAHYSGSRETHYGGSRGPNMVDQGGGAL